MGMFKKKFDNGNVIRSIFLAYFILIFHVGLLAVLGILVLFFGGIARYMVWILLGAGALISGSIVYLWFQFKKNSIAISKVLMLPEFRGKNIEVRFLGGLASLKVNDASDTRPMLRSDQSRLYLEDPEAVRIRELMELARLLEKDLITPDEYYRAKRELFGS